MEHLGDLRLARPTGPVMFYRGRVPDLGAGWRAGALPLTGDNADDAPTPSASPGSHSDGLTSSDPLLLYRVLWTPGDRAARNSLRAVKAPAAGVDLSY